MKTEASCFTFEKEKLEKEDINDDLELEMELVKQVEVKSTIQKQQM